MKVHLYAKKYLLLLKKERNIVISQSGVWKSVYKPYPYLRGREAVSDRTQLKEKQSRKERNKSTKINYKKNVSLIIFPQAKDLILSNHF